MYLRWKKAISNEGEDCVGGGLIWLKADERPTVWTRIFVAITTFAVFGPIASAAILKRKIGVHGSKLIGPTAAKSTQVSKVPKLIRMVAAKN